MIPSLPQGRYPFIDERLPLSEMTMVEAPPQLEALFKAQAARNGAEIIRDEPVELRCQSPEYPDATFLVYWLRELTESTCLCPRNLQSVGLDWKPMWPRAPSMQKVQIPSANQRHVIRSHSRIRLNSNSSIGGRSECID